ncbi:mannose-1-phosphate guanylyltransferase [Arenibacter sp. GZD96]|uniref:mannose-1-phosphate guanylyltransferase n=1 Tax=Aurantibrevibacter litoralis TaxID=3106030 RepID=UPI002B000006|nr:mannose-1-phosphate guanylyltransferase [Arenibacter sp. GZD-96]MEA1785935.1 mannose-1-phosphate guanylyltransferase [Arenibacter sp. GZD-96]
MNKNYYAVIMAGGVGSRFWPISTAAHPKQFHDMLGTGDTLIQKTFKRLNTFVPTSNIFILTNERYNDIVLEQLPMVQPQQVVLEPAMRNTAPCILYAALKIQKINPNAVMVVAPSDHWIEDETAFATDVEQCFEFCTSENVLCTLGITPTFPNTGYGYIEYEQGKPNGLRKVHQFREKPDYENAKAFIAQGNFLWNAGIFMWSVKTILNAFKQHQPQQFQLFEAGMAYYNTDKEAQFITENYPLAANISIDYAILEPSDAIYVLPARFDWNDLGTWSSLYDKLAKDEHRNAIVNSAVLCEDAHGNMIRSSKGKIVIVDGLHDYIIVDKEEVLLIYPKSKEQEIKNVVANVKNTFGEKFT